MSRPILGVIVILVICIAAVAFALSNEAPEVALAPTVATSTPTVATTTSAVTPTPTTKPVATTTPAVKPVTIEAYLTGYAWPDNTPPGSAISNPVIHHEAGGTGTYADPITVAVGHSFINGDDVLDYLAGTLFYMPYLRKYFIAEDTCGDGDTPQNVPCHNLHMAGNEAPAGAEAWLDLWVGGVGSTQSVVLKCEDAITGLHTVIMKPSPNYAVIAGPVYESSCAQQFSDTPVTQ
jgi:hypothetical protein